MIFACKCLNTVISLTRSSTDDTAMESPSSEATTNGLESVIRSVQKDEKYQKNSKFCKELLDFIRNHSVSTLSSSIPWTWCPFHLTDTHNIDLLQSFLLRCNQWSTKYSNNQQKSSNQKQPSKNVVISSEIIAQYIVYLLFSFNAILLSFLNPFLYSILSPFSIFFPPRRSADYFHHVDANRWVLCRTCLLSRPRGETSCSEEELAFRSNILQLQTPQSILAGLLIRYDHYEQEATWSWRRKNPSFLLLCSFLVASIESIDSSYLLLSSSFSQKLHCFFISHWFFQKVDFRRDLSFPFPSLWPASPYDL